MKSFLQFFYEKSNKYTPDRLPPDAKLSYTGRGGKKLRIATAIAYRSHEAIRDDSIPEFTQETEYSKKVSGRNMMSKRVKPLESKYLYQWAKEKGLLMDNNLFDQNWTSQGRKGEAENNVYYDESSGRWFKRNNLSYHSTYLDFFYRLALHNQMFPEAIYELEGFVVNNGELQPVISQPHVKAERGATKQEVENLMSELGYRKIPGTNHDYYNKEKGIRVEDLHDENVLFHNGNFYVVDPVIYLDDEGKSGRITSNNPLAHEL